MNIPTADSVPGKIDRLLKMSGMIEGSLAYDNLYNKPYNSTTRNVVTESNFRDANEANNPNDQGGFKDAVPWYDPYKNLDLGFGLAYRTAASQKTNLATTLFEEPDIYNHYLYKNSNAVRGFSSELLSAALSNIQNPFSGGLINPI